MYNLSSNYYARKKVKYVRFVAHLLRWFNVPDADFNSLTKIEVGYNILAGSICPKATEAIHRLIKRPKHIQKIEGG